MRGRIGQRRGRVRRTLAVLAGTAVVAAGFVETSGPAGAAHSDGGVFRTSWATRPRARSTSIAM